MKKLKQAAALSYEQGQQGTPKVIANGRGQIAEKIIAIAKENHIPVVKNDWASEVLCNLPVNSEIPEVLYQVIAEIYAYILSIENKSMEKGK